MPGRVRICQLKHRTVTPYTIQLYKERITQIKRSKVEIAKEEVNM